MSRDAVLEKVIGLLERRDHDAGDVPPHGAPRHLDVLHRFHMWPKTRAARREPGMHATDAGVELALIEDQAGRFNIFEAHERIGA
jgi:hypothetical protein